MLVTRILMPLDLNLSKARGVGLFHSVLPTTDLQKMNNYKLKKARVSGSKRRVQHKNDCWKTKNSVVECKASENVCENYKLPKCKKKTLILKY